MNKKTTAKEHLSQLDELEKKIKNKKSELIETRKYRGFNSSSGNESGKVQTTFCGSDGKQTESQALRIVTLEEEIEDKLIEYMETRNKLIDQIHNIKDSLYIDILYCRYAKNEKNFAKIACDMGYSYKYVINKHGEALMAFEKAHPELF